MATSFLPLPRLGLTLSKDRDMTIRPGDPRTHKWGPPRTSPASDGPSSSSYTARDEKKAEALMSGANHKSQCTKLQWDWRNSTAISTPSSLQPPDVFLQGIPESAKVDEASVPPAARFSETKKRKLREILANWIRSRNSHQVNVPTQEVNVSRQDLRPPEFPPKTVGTLKYDQSPSPFARYIAEVLLRSHTGSLSAKEICKIMQHDSRYKEQYHSGWQALIMQELAQNPAFEAVALRRRGRSADRIKWRISSRRWDEILQHFQNATLEEVRETYRSQLPKSASIYGTPATTVSQGDRKEPEPPPQEVRGESAAPRKPGTSRESPMLDCANPSNSAEPRDKGNSGSAQDGGQHAGANEDQSGSEQNSQAESSSARNAAGDNTGRKANGKGDDDDDSGNNRKRKRFRQVVDCSSRRLFRCPYHMRDPLRYGKNDRRYLTCEGTTYQYISELLRHLGRIHDDFVCGKCLHFFEDKRTREEHMSSCTVSLRCSQEERWFTLWRMKFPDQSPPLTPYREPLRELRLNETAERQQSSNHSSETLGLSPSVSTPEIDESTTSVASESSSSRIGNQQKMPCPWNDIVPALKSDMTSLVKRVSTVETRLPLLEQRTAFLIQQLSATLNGPRDHARDINDPTGGHNPRNIGTDQIFRMPLYGGFVPEVSIDENTMDLDGLAPTFGGGDAGNLSSSNPGIRSPDWSTNLPPLDPSTSNMSFDVNWNIGDDCYALS